MLNLKLKDSKKSILFGKAEVGAGVENKFLADVNVGLISPAIKFLDLAFANNTGTSAESQFNDYIFENSDFNDFNKNHSIDIIPDRLFGTEHCRA